MSQRKGTYDSVKQQCSEVLVQARVHHPPIVVKQQDILDIKLRALGRGITNSHILPARHTQCSGLVHFAVVSVCLSLPTASVILYSQLAYNKANGITSTALAKLAL